MHKTALILSSGRTGTQFLAHYFDANYDEVVARHEPSPTRLLRVASYAHLSGRLSDERLRALLARQRPRRELGPGVTWYVESNPFLVGFADVLGAVWDDPVVVHVVRDPREHARSALNHGTGRGLKAAANRLLPYWLPDVRRLLALDHRPSWLELAAGVWAIANRHLSAVADRYPGYHLLHYERIFDATHTGLRELCGILGLGYREEGAPVPPSERINRGRHDALPPWRDWTPAQCRALHAICSPQMQHFGYGREPEWLERVAGHG